ncbi:MAG: transcription antitermination factor NusB [Holosporaceae bacterium]|jgi:N utilization substance protein B|nr:transcription antitermination factor NusB [Holosporaceae bacterium]
MAKDNKSKSGLRGMARFCAVQTVYRAGITGCTMGTIAAEFNGRGEIFITENISISEMDGDFFLRLIKIIEDNLPEIDEIISKNLSDNWKFGRLDNVMKSVLRLGAAELLYFKDIPANVVFNEYIEISKSFFEKSEVAFINGILNSIGNSAPQ